ncbi:hypothetical protein D3C87_1085510 [compost metagenome]
MKKFVFVTQESCYNKLVVETTFDSAVYHHVDETDLMLFIFDEDKSNEEFEQHYLDFYKHLDYELFIDHNEPKSEYNDEIIRLMSEEVNNKFVLYRK